MFHYQTNNVLTHLQDQVPSRSCSPASPDEAQRPTQPNSFSLSTTQAISQPSRDSCEVGKHRFVEEKLMTGVDADTHNVRRTQRSANMVERIKNLKVTIPVGNNQPQQAARVCIQPVIAPNGAIYYVARPTVSVFDVFPGILMYRSRRFRDCDRVDFLLPLSESSSLFLQSLHVDESKMWYAALKYVFNGIALLPIEVRSALKTYMATHKCREVFLNWVKHCGFQSVIREISKRILADKGELNNSAQ